MAIESIGSVLKKKGHEICSETTVLDAMATMSRHRFRNLPVLEDGRLAGVISMGDLMSEVISGQAFTIDQLQKYISG
jgi:CBS domain-containing protein